MRVWGLRRRTLAKISHPPSTTKKTSSSSTMLTKVRKWAALACLTLCTQIWQNSKSDGKRRKRTRVKSIEMRSLMKKLQILKWCKRAWKRSTQTKMAKYLRMNSGSLSCGQTRPKIGFKCRRRREILRVASGHTPCKTSKVRMCRCKCLPRRFWFKNCNISTSSTTITKRCNR